MKYTWWPVLTFFLGALLAWLFARWGWKKGKTYEEIIDRVVEESSDESTKIRTLTEGHESGLLKLRADHDASLAKLKADCDASLVALRKEHDAALATHKTEATRLQGLVSIGGGAKSEFDALRAELQKAKDEHSRLELDWKKKIEVAEGAALANTGKLRELEASHAKAIADWDGRVKAADAKLEADWKLRYGARETELNNSHAAKTRDLEASHTRALGEWETRVKAAEAKHVEVQGLLGTAKTDTDKVSADWSARVAKLESELANSRDVSARADADWKARYAKLEADFASTRDAAATRDAAYRDLETRYRTLEANHTESQTSIRGLTSQLSEATAQPDNLMVIEGVGPKINQALNASGITQWKHVRDADEPTLRGALEKGGITFAPSMATWSAQARYLCDGDMIGFTAYTEYLVSGQDPSKSTGQGVEDYIAQARPRIAASLSPTQDDLRTNDGRDNLLIIEGIGPKFSQALLDAGLNSFEKVAQASEDSLRSAISNAGLSFAPSLPTWAKQAELLAKGDRAGFDEYVAFLLAGRDA